MVIKLNFMKTFVNLIVGFISLNLIAQAVPDFTTSAFGLSKDVVKLEEKTYKIDETTKNYVIHESILRIFENGLLKQYVSDYKGFFPSTTTTDYAYNASGQVVKVVKTFISAQKDQSVNNTNYIYKNGKLIEINTDDTSGNTTATKYTYDVKGKLLKGEKQNQDGELEQITDFYTVVDDKNYNKKTSYFYKSDEANTTNIEQYVNGRNITFQSQSQKYGNSFYDYQYDQYGNITLSTEDFVENVKNIYEYDNKGNWLKCKSNIDDWISGYEERFTFRKITFKTGSIGSTDLDQSFINKFNSTNQTAQTTNKTSSGSTTKKSASNPGCEGDCQNGYGSYYYIDGAIYDGYFSNGFRNGPGAYTFTNGDSYEGMWVNGVKEGYAIYKWKDGSYYAGYYKNDKLNGEGFYLSSTGEIKGGSFKDGNFDVTSILTDNGATTGCVSQDCTNGFGKFYYSNGDFFIGFFSNGYLKSGLYSYSNKDAFIGEFSNGQRHGFGYYLWADKSNYFGMYQNGTYHGLGYYYVDTDETKDQIGEFRNGTLFKSMK